ncbi:hypothetical protein [Algicella marina]|uniref:Uncharacterized protein n=1 Tax=Algicella marina TaxID=2683284 RepID=A0A6P1SW56_9RHOB|nr:hypothetical protein [Algicella marina]QHQ33997.1 hypothetical protein GO499_01760 [Algicella marina]
MKETWHLERQHDAVTVSRPGRARLDVAVSRALDVTAPVSLARMAHQIRQDVWRALAGQRGFSPVVHITRRVGGLDVTAGGMISARNPLSDRLHNRIGAVLDCPRNRDRWCRFARHKRALAGDRPRG